MNKTTTIHVELAGGEGVGESPVRAQLIAHFPSSA